MTLLGRAEGLEMFGLIVGVVALVLGLWHLYEIRAQAKDIRAQAKDIRSQAELSESHAKILNSILLTQSTHHIGQFPDYISAIAELIGQAKKGIVILCDFPAYGSFSASHDFLKYRHAIERKIDEDVPVKITYLSPACRLALTREQFSKEEKIWDGWKKKNHERFRAFLQSHDSEISVDDLSIEQFAAFLEEEDVRMVDETFARADTLPTDTYIPLYFWLIDESSAVFAIPSFSEKSTEHGFYTLDPHLISGFLDIEARYHREVVDHNSTIAPI
jgi:hypothetical protein